MKRIFHMDTVEEKQHTGWSWACSAWWIQIKRPVCIKQVLPFRSQEGTQKATETALWAVVLLLKHIDCKVTEPRVARSRKLASGLTRKAFSANVAGKQKWRKRSMRAPGLTTQPIPRPSGNIPTISSIRQLTSESSFLGGCTESVYTLGHYSVFSSV